MNKAVKFFILLFAAVIVGCADSNDNEVNVTDTTPPVISLEGASTILLTVGETYTEAGSTVTDNIDTGLSASISGTVDTSSVGTYTITYSVSDAAGNEASAIRTVVVSGPIDTTPPVIVLEGASTILLAVGETYTEAGSTVTDNIDTGLSADISGTVDTSTAGTYTITYTVSDAAGNQASAIRTVVVSDPTIEGDAYIFHSLNDDSYFMEYWGDTWGTGTQYTDQPADTTYAKALEISKSSEWGTVVAWGNEPENAVDISAYTHARFKVKTDTFTAVEVFVQSPSGVDTQVTYNIANGTDLQNGWVEMEVALPGFSDMSWFALNFIGSTGTVLLADVYFTISDNVVIPPVEGDAYVFHSLNDDTYFMQYWGDTWGTGTQYTDQPADTTYAKALEISKSSEWGTVVAWGNEPENAVDISAYTHARFKVKSDTFTAVEVFVQSFSSVDTQVTYNIANGTDLQNGWVEMEVALPGFSDMSWFALNFIGSTGTVLLADVYFTTQQVVVSCAPIAAPTPPLLDDNDVVVLFSDAFTQDGFIGVWNANWWNAPVYSECDISGDHIAKYQITDGGTAGGVVGLEYGFEIEPLDASAKTRWNIDLYVEAGITRVSLQLVSSDGSATYVINSPSVGTWESYDILFSDMTDNDGGGSGVLNPGTLQAAGIQLYGDAGQSVYIDNFYFSGQSDFYNLSVTVTDNLSNPLTGAVVSVGNVSATTAANGIATLNIHEGEHRVVVDAEGFGVAQGNQSVLGGDASLSLSVSPLNAGPSQAAPATTVADEDAIVLYSDSLVVDQYISFWSDDWWNAPTFSELNIDGDNTAKLQIIPNGVAGGVTGIQYGIENGALDASTAVGIRFDMFASSGITRTQFQVLSATGTGIHTINSVITGQWVTVTIPFADLTGGAQWSASALTQLGVALWGTTSDAVYLDNIYFYK